MPFHLLRKVVPKELHIKASKPIFSILGCALFSSVSAGILKNTDEFCEFIEYKKGLE